MMKKILLLVALVVVIAGGFWIYQANRNEKKADSVALDPKNCSYIFEGKNITLANGYAEESIDSDTTSKVITQYFGNEAKGDFNNDNKEDVAFIATQSSGGSGTFYYAVVALSGNNECIGTNAMYLGDRIAPQTTEFKDNLIIANYAERNTGEPMTTAPSVGVSKYFIVENNILIEKIK